MPQPQPPNVADFTIWVRNVMGVSAAYLPDSSPFFQYALNYAINTVNLDIAGLAAKQGSWSLYQLACFNLAGAILVEFAPDVSYSVAGITWLGGIATLQTAAQHSILPGDKLTIAGISPNGFNSNSVKAGYVVVVSALDNTHITYPVVPNPGAVVSTANATASEQFFMNARRGFKIAGFIPGVVSNASDLSTGAGFLNPDFLRGLTLENIQLLKTPFGRSYLGIAQKYGPTVWGIN